MHYIKTAFIAVIGAVSLFLAGCTPQAKHPNEINAFDGATYDSLTVAHSALVSLRGTVAAQYPQYTNVFDQAASAYSVAYNAYSVYRSTAGNEGAVSMAVANLTVSIVALENQIQTDMHVPATTVAHVRGRAMKMRAAAQPRITISDILTELEIASTIAASVPGTQPYANLAAIVIRVTQQAVTALQSTSGQPINLALIEPVAQL